MDTIEPLILILSTANLFGGDIIAFLCLFSTILTTIGTFTNIGLLHRLQRAWTEAIGTFILGSIMAASHAINLPMQETIIFHTKPTNLLLIYALCIAMLSGCAIKTAQHYK